MRGMFRKATLLLIVAVPVLAQRTQKPPLHGAHWMAVTGKPLAATAGSMIFQKGGNAATIGSSSTTNDSVLTITGLTSNTAYGGIIQDSLSGGTMSWSLRVPAASSVIGTSVVSLPALKSALSRMARW